MTRRAGILLSLLFLSACEYSRPAHWRNVDGQTVCVHVEGVESAQVEKAGGTPEDLKETYDVVIIGGGLSGLTASWYLRDRKILCLERKEQVGGLAFRGVTREGVIYGRGAAYYTRGPKVLEEVYKELGLGDYEKTAIPEPIDSYFYKGKLYRGVWEEDTLKKLPPGFKQFKEALLEADKNHQIPEQPFEEFEDLSLDGMTAAEWLKPFGPEVKAFLDSYCQSALGSTTDNVNAAAFANFYISEIETRYAWPGGTAGASVHIAEMLRQHNSEILRTGATVTQVRNAGGEVEIVYVQKGDTYRIRSKYAILAVPLNIGAWLLKEYPEDRRELVKKLSYADYLVHSVFTRSDLFRDTYDTWFTDKSFTDVIVARWLETRGFKEKPREGPGILSIYQPLSPFKKIARLDEKTVADLAAKGVRELRDLVPALAKEPSLDVESYRWPASIHIVPVHFFKEWVPRLKEPVGRVYFAANNLGTPSVEEAVYRGWSAAQLILKKLLSRAPRRDRVEVYA